MVTDNSMSIVAAMIVISGHVRTQYVTLANLETDNGASLFQCTPKVTKNFIANSNFERLL